MGPWCPAARLILPRTCAPCIDRAPLSRPFVFPTEQPPRPSAMGPPPSLSPSALSCRGVGGAGAASHFQSSVFPGVPGRIWPEPSLQVTMASAKGVWIFMTTHMPYVYRVSSTVCIRADNKNSVYNKNKHFVAELGFKAPVKALQRFILV